MKKKVILGIAISAVFLYLAFEKVDFREVLNALQGANYWWLLPGVAMMFISLLIRAHRWMYFLEPIKHVRLRQSFSAMMIGYMANNVLPLRLGEFFRAFAIGQSAQISKASSFATILVERIIDVVSLVVILGVTMLFHEFPPYVRNTGLAIFFGAVGLIIFIVFLMERTRGTMRFVMWMAAPLPLRMKKALSRVMRSFLRGFEVFRASHHYAMIVVESIALWLLYAGIILATFYAFDLQLQGASTFLVSLVLLVMISIGIMIPSSPGFIGTYHYFCIQGLSLFGVAESEALSFALVLHITNFLPMTIVGLYYFWRQNLHFSDALHEKAADNSQQPASVQEEIIPVPDPELDQP